jgi:hypothetical protein
LGSFSPKPGGPFDSELKRTGRTLTEEEIALSNSSSRDNGKLPVQQGVKLIEPSEIFLRKSSRLTKDEERQAVFAPHTEKSRHRSPRTHHELMSTLQEQFLQSIMSEAARLELRFHMTKV